MGGNLLVDEEPRAGTAQADRWFGDRNEQRHEAAGLIEKAADVQPAGLRPEA